MFGVGVVDIGLCDVVSLDCFAVALMKLVLCLVCRRSVPVEDGCYLAHSFDPEYCPDVPCRASGRRVNYEWVRDEEKFIGGSDAQKKNG